MSEKTLKDRIKTMSKFFKKKTGEDVEEVREFIKSDVDAAVNRGMALIAVSEDEYTEPLIIKTPATTSENDVTYRITEQVTEVEREIETEVKTENESGEEEVEVETTVETEEVVTYLMDYDRTVITSIFLGGQALYYHETEVDHTTGKSAYDIAGELNLFDILHTETIIEYDDLDDHSIYRVFLKLNLVDGNNLTFYLRQHFIYEHDQNETVLLSEKEQYIIKTIKEAIRLSK